MNSNPQTMPWNYVDSFGKSIRNSSPGQAHLTQWPLKLKLISPVAPYFHKAHLILSADCVAFSYRNFHSNLLRNRVLVIGCPELDGIEFGEKLALIVQHNEILSIAVARMDAPCCMKLADAVIAVVRKSHKDIPVQVITVFTEGEIVN